MNTYDNTFLNTQQNFKALLEFLYYVKDYAVGAGDEWLVTKAKVTFGNLRKQKSNDMTATNVFSIKQAKYPKPKKFIDLVAKMPSTPKSKESSVSSVPAMSKVGYIDSFGNYYNLEQYEMLLEHAKQHMLAVFVVQPKD